MTSLDEEVDRYEAVRQYSLAEILAVWAAAAVPMGLLAWVVAPWLEDQLSGDEPLTQALLILLTAGLVWQFVLVVILLRLELGSLRWPECATRCGSGPREIRRPDAWAEGCGGGRCSSSNSVRCGRWCPRYRVRLTGTSPT